eukprot:gnl/TRDRNA2_/TRDRNA2_36015_c0_seq2.p1 gnl/TRDRNA2_/TRDRNA2_36015_c0~~gnl/TRDRNA2_/TRDRNA2_36015_c0_seq2.p1  ORF type:complete len:464 (-),score=185.08 gnl/TRDRNA2_/TRDRNA2_36015_c0_seq2:54-1445(-)
MGRAAARAMMRALHFLVLTAAAQGICTEEGCSSDEIALLQLDVGKLGKNAATESIPQEALLQMDEMQTMNLEDSFELKDAIDFKLEEIGKKSLKLLDESELIRDDVQKKFAKAISIVQQVYQVFAHTSGEELAKNFGSQYKQEITSIATAMGSFLGDKTAANSLDEADQVLATWTQNVLQKFAQREISKEAPGHKAAHQEGLSLAQEFDSDVKDLMKLAHEKFSAHHTESDEPAEKTSLLEASTIHSGDEERPSEEEEDEEDNAEDKPQLEKETEQDQSEEEKADDDGESLLQENLDEEEGAQSNKTSRNDDEESRTRQKAAEVQKRLEKAVRSREESELDEGADQQEGEVDERLSLQNKVREAQHRLAEKSNKYKAKVQTMEGEDLLAHTVDKKFDDKKVAKKHAVVETEHSKKVKGIQASLEANAQKYKAQEVEEKKKEREQQVSEKKKSKKVHHSALGDV